MQTLLRRFVLVGVTAISITSSYSQAQSFADKLKAIDSNKVSYNDPFFSAKPYACDGYSRLTYYKDKLYITELLSIENLKGMDTSQKETLLNEITEKSNKIISSVNQEMSRLKKSIEADLLPAECKADIETPLLLINARMTIIRDRIERDYQYKVAIADLKYDTTIRILNFLRFYQVFAETALAETKRLRDN